MAQKGSLAPNPPRSSQRLNWVTGAALAALLVGCASVKTSVSESAQDYNFTYSARSTAAPFGRVDATAHSLLYTAEGADLRVGQDAQGLDNSGQIAVVDTLVTALVRAFASGLISPGGGMAPDPTLLQRLNSALQDLQELRQQLRDIGILQ